MKLHIKNMVCSRCKLVVKSELEKLGLHLLNVELGEVELASHVSKELTDKIKERLDSFGFELMDDKKSQTIEKIKIAIIDLVHNKNSELKIKLSDYLKKQLNQDYVKLSNLFSEVENTTLEKYFINQKIERVKELLVYDELNLNEISYLLNYSSVAYLSNQFKKVTGFTPTYYKSLKEKKRKHIEDL